MEAQLTKEVTQQCKKFNRRFPEVIVLLHEEGAGVCTVAEKGPKKGKKSLAVVDQSLGSAQKTKSKRATDLGKEEDPPSAERKGPVGPPPVEKLPVGLVASMRAANPRENPSPDMDPENLTYG
jgi:hypothetical protein